MQLAFAAARVPGKNVQDELCSVDYAAFGVLFNIALLHGRKVAIKNNQRRVFDDRFGANFVELAAAHERCRISFIAQLENRAGDCRARAARELHELGEGLALGRTSLHSRDPCRPFPGNANKKSAFGGSDGLRGFHRPQRQEANSKAPIANWATVILASIRRRSVRREVQGEFCWCVRPNSCPGLSPGNRLPKGQQVAIRGKH